MTDAPEPVPNGQPTVEQAALAADADAAAASANGTGAPSGPAVSAAPAPPVAEDRPELVVGAAFAGGFVLALLLKRLAR